MRGILWGGAAAALVFALLWGVPAFEPLVRAADAHTEQGQTQTFRTSLGTPGHVASWNWTATVDVPGDAASNDVRANLLVSLREVGPPTRGAAGVVISIRIYVNDALATEGVVRSSDVPSARMPVPGPGAAFSQEALRVGRNVVRVEANADVDPAGAPSTSIEGSLGPVVVDRVALDTDGDGVVDAFQPFHLHSGLAALVVAVPVSLIAGIVGRRRA